MVLLAAIAALALASTAAAHVTVHPNLLPSGGWTKISIQVPSEQPNASTTRVDVKFPAGFNFVSYEPVPGWKTKVLYRKIAKPVTIEGEKVTQEVDRVIWSGGHIAPGQFVEFPLSVALPKAKPGSTLTFKALQTYSNGQVERWIGPAGTDTPAPQVLMASSTSAIMDFPGGVPAARKALAHSGGAFSSVVIGVPAAAAAAFAAMRLRRRRAA